MVRRTTSTLYWALEVERQKRVVQKVDSNSSCLMRGVERLNLSVVTSASSESAGSYWIYEVHSLGE